MAKDKSKSIDYHEFEDLPEFYQNMSNVASANETTGMMPTPPQNVDELNNYHDLSSIAIPKSAPPRNRDKETRRAETIPGRTENDHRPTV